MTFAALALAVPATASGAAGDPLRPRQWALDMLGAERAWRASTGAGVVVAVVGSGADLAHPDLRGAIAPGGADLISPNQPPQDDSGGGTIAAGIVAARRGNGAGTVGVAPAATILPIRVSDTQTQYGPHVPFVEEFADPELIGKGIRYAADRRARVIVVATAVYVFHDAFDRSTLRPYDLAADVEYAWSKGAVVVVPGGDHGPFGCPYAGSRAICAGAVDSRGEHAHYSRAQHQGGTVVCAPGGSSAGLFTDPGYDSFPATLTSEDVVAPVARGATFGEDYLYTSGTTVAAAHVGGVAALLAAKRLTNAAIVDRIVSTASDVAPPGDDPFCGSGLVSAAHALGVA